MVVGHGVYVVTLVTSRLRVATGHGIGTGIMDTGVGGAGMIDARVSIVCRNIINYRRVDDGTRIPDVDTIARQSGACQEQTQ